MAEQEKNIFSRQALDSINSPEQLNDYMKVTNPGIWMILAAVILLLAGLFAWASAGQLETTADAVAVIENGTARITLTEAAAVPMSSEMRVRIEMHDFNISTVKPDEYGRAVAYAPVTLPDRNYDAKVIVESISPMTFLFV